MSSCDRDRDRVTAQLGRAETKVTDYLRSTVEHSLYPRCCSTRGACPPQKLDRRIADEYGNATHAGSEKSTVNPERLFEDRC